ncbi:MAG: gliding motility-associated C-terminal domain-containing protein [Saprospiraceae bacterium]|nr:gliding motility-associated C-terminal domain-containing protein [Saprospiraceae bacterium]
MDLAVCVLLDDIMMVECCVATDTVTVTVLPEIMEVQDHLICEGESVEVGGQTFDQAGTYEVVLNSFQNCDSTIQVNVELAQVEAFVSPPAKISCLLEQVQLDGSGSVGEFGISNYSWSTVNGLILSNPSGSFVEVGAGGTYTLTVTTTNGQISCMDEVDVLVEIDTITPVFSIDPAPPPPCDDPIVTLNANGVNLPPNAQPSWSTWNGQIISGGNTLMPTVSGSGVYTLLVTNPANGCYTLDSVQVQADTNKPVILPLLIPDITCKDSQALIAVAVPVPVTGYTAQWMTSDGNILSSTDTLTILVDQGGQYVLTVTDQISGCTSEFTAIVNELTNPPTPLLPVPDTLNCLVNTLNILATLPPGVDSLSVLWTTSNGLILNGADSLEMTLGQAGTYAIHIQDLESGCQDSAMINVISNAQLPAVAAGPDQTIDCKQDTIIPQTAGSASGPGIFYSWTKNGVGFTGDTLLQPVLTGAGTYILEVINTWSGCRNTDTLIITNIASIPVIQITTTDTLDCVTAQVTIDASASDQGTHTLSWSGPPGGILTNGTTLLPTIGQPGWYVLTSLDTTNQCTNQDSVLVQQDIQVPLISILPADSLDCVTTSLQLDGSLSNPSGNLLFSWSTQSGNIVSGSTTATPLISGGGMYVLELTNPDNGCTARDSVFVFQDPDLPVASIQDADTLTCLLSEMTLVAAIQSSNPNVTYSWTTLDGSILSGANSLMPLINGPGTYFFSLTDPSSGCMTSDQVIVYENIVVPDVLISSPDTLTCLVQQVSLTANPVNFNGTLFYQWTTVDGQIIGPTTSNPITVGLAGTYALQWTVPENGCSQSIDQIVIENTVPPLADAGMDEGIPCNGQTLQLDGSGSFGQGSLTYQWSTANGQILSGGNTSMPMIGQAGLYQLTVQDEQNGCESTDDVVISPSGSNIVAFSLVEPLCSTPGSITLQPTGGTPPVMMTIGGVNGSFSPGETVLLATGVWPVTVIDGSGCVFDTVITMLSAQTFALTAPSSVFLSPGSPGQIVLTVNIPPNQIAEVSWSPASGIGATSDPLIWTVSVTESTTYEVVVKTFDGCAGMATIQVDLVTEPPVLFIPNVFSPKDINGINDVFFPLSRPGTITAIKNMAIYDRWGNNLFLREDFPPDDANYGWDGSYRNKVMDPGVYIWVIEVILPDGETRVYKGDVTIF